MSKKFLNGLSVGAQTFTSSGLSNISNISSTGVIESPYMTPAQIYASTASVTGNISINPSNGTYDGVLSLGSANTTTYLNGNTYIYDAGNSLGAIFTVSSLTATRSFAFPNTSGTFALTSGNLSLSATTVSGTTATFTGTGTFATVVATTVTATTVNATTATLTGKLSLATTATNRASVNIPASGTVPTSGNYAIGDVWVSGTALTFATATNASKIVMWSDLSNAVSPTNNSLSLGSGSLTATAVTATAVTSTTGTFTNLNIGTTAVKLVNGGTGTLSSTNAVSTIAHGLPGTPSSVVASVRNNTFTTAASTTIYVGNITSTNFTLFASNGATGVAAGYSWMAVL